MILYITSFHTPTVLFLLVYWVQERPGFDSPPNFLVPLTQAPWCANMRCELYSCLGVGVKAVMKNHRQKCNSTIRAFKGFFGHGVEVDRNPQNILQIVLRMQNQSCQIKWWDCDLSACYHQHCCLSFSTVFVKDDLFCQLTHSNFYCEKARGTEGTFCGCKMCSKWGWANLWQFWVFFLQ